MTVDARTRLRDPSQDPFVFVVQGCQNAWRPCPGSACNGLAICAMGRIAARHDCESEEVRSWFVRSAL